MSQLYEVVFYGKLEDGFSEETTKQHVAQLFKTSVDQVERMFSGKRVVIRNKLDMETAQKYIGAMKKRGASCQIEGMGSPGVVVDPKAVDAKVAAPGAAAPQAMSQESTTPVTTPQTSAQPQSQAAPVQSSVNQTIGSASSASSSEPASKSGLKLAGEKADEILATVHLDLDPAGIRLSEEHHEEFPELPGLDSLSIAPAGSDLADKKEEVPVSVPDISHLSLE